MEPLGLDFIGGANSPISIPMSASSGAYGQQGDSGGLTVGAFNVGSNNTPLYVGIAAATAIALILVLK